MDATQQVNDMFRFLEISDEEDELDINNGQAIVRSVEEEGNKAQT